MILLTLEQTVAIIKAYIIDLSVERLQGLFISFLAAVFSLLLSIVVSRFAFRNEEGIERFGAAFSNEGFIGIPLPQVVESVL